MSHSSGRSGKTRSQSDQDGATTSPTRCSVRSQAMRNATEIVLTSRPDWLTWNAAASNEKTKDHEGATTNPISARSALKFMKRGRNYT